MTCSTSALTRYKNHPALQQSHFDPRKQFDFLVPLHTLFFQCHLQTGRDNQPTSAAVGGMRIITISNSKSQREKKQNINKTILANADSENRNM